MHSAIILYKQAKRLLNFELLKKSFFTLPCLLDLLSAIVKLPFHYLPIRQ